jgi:rare lipoprotein A (peptidoglycan hydrolase)
MRRPLTYVAALLLVLSVRAGAGRQPIWLALDRTQGRQEQGRQEKEKTDQGLAQNRGAVGCKALQQVGAASWYGEQYHGKITASGEPFDMYGFTAAHATLPLGTFVRVTNLNNGRILMVRVNDRGPFVRGRIIDVSYNAARILDFLKDGVQRVVLDFEECQRSDGRISGQAEAVPVNKPLHYRLQW